MKNRRDDEMDVERNRQSSSSKRKRSDSPESPEAKRQSRDQPSEEGGGLREMGVDEMNALRAKLGLRPLYVNTEPKEVKTEQSAEPTKIVDVEDKIAMYVSILGF